MKIRKRPRGHINFNEGQEGSIVVEAALIMPLFLFVLLFLICLVRISVVQMALQDAAAQAARLTAAHIRPAALSSGALAAGVPAIPSLPAPLGDAGPILAELAGRMPAPAGPILSSAASGDWTPAVNMAASEIGKAVAEPLVRQLAEGSPLTPERIALHGLTLPDLSGGDNAYIALEIRYDFPLRFPFTREALTLRAFAEERVWIGDSVPSANRSDRENETGQLIRIIGIEPSPVRPGRKARLIVQTDPGSRVSLSVEYKSGTSKAKHLGEAAASSDGMVEWEWLVSGNTTPGTWELFVEGEEGARTGMHFDVRKGD